MGDYFQTIVDTGATLEEADHLARHVVSLLSERGVVAAKPSQEGGYDRGPNAKDISLPAPALREHERIPPVHTHLQVLIGRMIHSVDLSEFKAPEARCPAWIRPEFGSFPITWPTPRPPTSRRPFDPRRSWFSTAVANAARTSPGTPSTAIYALSHAKTSRTRSGSSTKA